MRDKFVSPSDTTMNRVYNLLNYKKITEIIPQYGSLFIILLYETKICRYRAFCTDYCFRSD